MFRNLTLFNVDTTKLPNIDNDELEAYAFKECDPSVVYSAGFVPPIIDGLYAHRLPNLVFVAVKVQEKIIPPSAIRNLVDAKVKALEVEGKKVSRDEKAAIRDSVYMEVIPRALSREKVIRAYIDTKAQMLVVDASTQKQVDVVTSLLRSAIGGLPIKPVEFNNADTLFTKWIVTQAPKNLMLLDVSEFVDNEGGKTTVRGTLADSSETHDIIQSGKMCTKLRVHLPECLEGTLAKDGVIRRVRFADEVYASNEDIEDEVSRKEADMLIMSEEVTKFIDELKDEGLIAS